MRCGTRLVGARQASDAAGIETKLNPGEAPFTGPMLEFVLRDAYWRDWQCGTPCRWTSPPAAPGAPSYVREDNQKHTPVMLHRAIFARWAFYGICSNITPANCPLVG